jgi:plasmid stabilization system protein ParE
MKYEIRLSRRATEDRNRAYAWYATNYSEEFALRWFTGITNAIESLAASAMSQPKAIESNRFTFDVYEVLYGSKRNKHRILFTFRDDVVYILHIRHSAQRELTEDDLLE